MRLPIGISDFRRVVDQESSQDPCVFIDKSLLIKEVIDGSVVTLITRPRRFGKTLNLSMLHHFFSNTVDGQPTQRLFDKLKIMQAGDKYTAYQGKHPVIFLSFKDVIATSFDQAYAKMLTVIRKLCAEHRELLKSDALYSDEKALFKRLLEKQGGREEVEDAINTISQYLKRHYKIRPIILIDEYDTPIQYAYEQDYYKDMIMFMRTFLGAGLKDNAHFEKAVLTGILRIARESLFSDLSNLTAHSVLDSKYSEHFGFTKEEVVELQEKTRSTVALSDVERWYNGYRIGEHTLYNPWSIIRCFSNQGKLGSYWVNTSENTLMRDLITQSNATIVQDMEALLRGETIEKNINPNMNFGDLVLTEMGLWTLLLMSGYLKTITQQEVDTLYLCQLAIPNQEVMGLYRTIIKQWLSGNTAIAEKDNFLFALLDGHVERFKEKLHDFILKVVSIHDLRSDQEYFYHALMLGATVFIDKRLYEVRSNREAGYGRFDLLILSKKAQNLSILLEFKAVKPSDANEQTKLTQLDKAAQAGLQQIDDKGYATELNQRGVTNVLKVGVAFSGKQLRIASNIDEIKPTSEGVNSINR